MSVNYSKFLLCMNNQFFYPHKRNDTNNNFSSGCSLLHPLTCTQKFCRNKIQFLSLDHHISLHHEDQASSLISFLAFLLPLEMARRLPSPEGNLLLHPSFSLPLFVACMAASVVLLASLCASCRRKPATSSPKSGSGEDEEKDGGSNEGILELEAQVHGPILGTVNIPTRPESKRSMSMGIKRGVSRMRTKKEHTASRKGGGEESLWKKTVILGEKCRMRTDDDDEMNFRQPGVEPQSTEDPKTP